MANYKVLQDIEAEDKLLGPLTLKQFVFAGVTIVTGFIGFRIIFSGAPVYIMIPMLVMLLPFFLLFGFLAAPIGRDQTSETWLLARLRFLFKPRVRIWSQDGLSELVTVTVPKKVDHIYVKDFTQDEVRSRLRALANTVDSRGWAIKNVNTNLFTQPDYIQTTAASSDRLLDPQSIPQEVPTIEVLASDDILDPINNPTAQHLYQMTRESTAQVKQEALNQMQAANPVAIANSTEQPADYYFMHENNVDTSNNPAGFVAFTSQHVVAPGSNHLVQAEETPEEVELAKQAKEREEKAKEYIQYHGPVIQPLHDKDGNLIKKAIEPAPAAQPEAGYTQGTQESMHEPANPGIISGVEIDGWKAKDRSVESLAREAKRQSETGKSEDGEVIISLH